MDAVLRDQASGFRHREVIEFISREVTLNGGGPNFYMAYRSRSWKEVEDQLLFILSDPRIPDPFKRANAWNALALSVRLGARQLDQDEYQIQRLVWQMNQHVAASKAMSTKLMWLREQHCLTMDIMRTIRCDLKKVLHEQDILLKQLCHLESTIPALAGPLMDAPQPGALLARRRAQLLQAIEQTDRMVYLPVPQPLPLWSQYQGALPSPRAFGSRPSKSEIENGATSGEKMSSHQDVYSPGHWPSKSEIENGATSGEKMSSHQDVYSPGHWPSKSEIENGATSGEKMSSHQDVYSSGHWPSKSEIENGATSGEKMSSHQNVYSPGHWPGAGTQKKMALPHTQRFPQGQHPKKSQAEGFKKEIKSRKKEKIPVNTKSEARSHFLTDLDVSQVAANLEKMQCRSNMSQEKGSQKKRSAPVVRKKSKMQTKTRKSAEYKQQDTHASRSRSMDWTCLSCKTLNFTCKTFCSGCHKSFETLEKELLVQYTQ